MKKKDYIYFVAFFALEKRKNYSWGHASIRLNHKITHNEQILEIEKKIYDSNNNIPVVILSFQLLRTENEK